MIGRIISALAVPVFIWMVIGSYKQIKEEHNFSEHEDFLFKIFWLVGITWATINLFTYAFLNCSIVLKIKHW
jgi:hypothetical protein